MTWDEIWVREIGILVKLILKSVFGNKFRLRLEPNVIGAEPEARLRRGHRMPHQEEEHEVSLTYLRKF